MIEEASGALSLGDSELGRLIAAHDWAATPLGPISQWPQSLRSVTAIMLRSTLPMAVLWGTEGIMLYNDGFAVIADGRHPGLLGGTVLEGWPEVVAFNEQVLAKVLAGESLAYRDQELVLLRDGRPEHMWANLDYAPLLDDQDIPAGVLAVVTDTTARVVAERRLVAERDRLRAMFAQAPGFIAMMEGPEHIFLFVNQAYTQLMGPRQVVGRTVRDAVPEAIDQGLLTALDAAYRTGDPFVAHDFLFAIPDVIGRIEDHYLDFVYQPVRDEAGMVYGIFAQGSDVTERVLAEAALRKREEDYRRLNDALIVANEMLAQPRAPS